MSSAVVVGALRVNLSSVNALRRVTILPETIQFYIHRFCQAKMILSFCMESSC